MSSRLQRQTKDPSRSAIRSMAPPLAGRRVTISLCNATGGALETATWGTAYRLAPWVTLAPGYSRSIQFRHNGEDWIEVARTPTDVPGVRLAVPYA